MAVLRLKSLKREYGGDQQTPFLLILPTLLDYIVPRANAGNTVYTEACAKSTFYAVPERKWYASMKAKVQRLSRFSIYASNRPHVTNASVLDATAIGKNILCGRWRGCKITKR